MDGLITPSKQELCLEGRYWTTDSSWQPPGSIARDIILPALGSFLIREKVYDSIHSTYLCAAMERMCFPSDLIDSNGAFNSVGALSHILQQDHVHIHCKGVENATTYLGFPLAPSRQQQDSFYDNFRKRIKITTSTPYMDASSPSQEEIPLPTLSCFPDSGMSFRSNPQPARGRGKYRDR